MKKILFLFVFFWCNSFVWNLYADQDSLRREIIVHQGKAVVVPRADRVGRRVFALRKDQSDSKSTFCMLKESDIEKQAFISKLGSEMGVSCVSNAFIVENITPCPGVAPATFLAEEIVKLAPSDLSKISDDGKRFIGLLENQFGACSAVELGSYVLGASPSVDFVKKYFLDHLDLENCQEILLWYILVSSGDTAPRNFMLKMTPDEKIILIKIDHEHDFLPYPTEVPFIFALPYLDEVLSDRLKELVYIFEEKISVQHLFMSEINRLFSELPDPAYYINNIRYSVRDGHRPYFDMSNRIKTFRKFISKYPQMPLNKAIAIAFSHLKSSYRLRQDAAFGIPSITHETSMGDIIWGNVNRGILSPGSIFTELFEDQSSQSLLLCDTLQTAKRNFRGNSLREMLQVNPAQSALVNSYTMSLPTQMLRVTNEILGQIEEYHFSGKNSDYVLLDKSKMAIYSQQGFICAIKLPKKVSDLISQIGQNYIVVLENERPLNRSNAALTIGNNGINPQGRYYINGQYLYIQASCEGYPVMPKDNAKSYRIAFIQKDIRLTGETADVQVRFPLLGVGYRPIDKTMIHHNAGYSYSYFLDDYLRRALLSGSTLTVVQGLALLPFVNSLETTIRDQGNGHYTSTKREVVFSTVGNVNPITTDLSTWSIVPAQTEIEILNSNTGVTKRLLVPATNIKAHSLDKSKIRQVVENIYGYKIPRYIRDRVNLDNQLRVLIVEDGKPLTTYAYDLRGKLGSYKNEDREMIFVASDGSNPQENPKTYVLVVAEDLDLNPADGGFDNQAEIDLPLAPYLNPVIQVVPPVVQQPRPVIRPNLRRDFLYISKWNAQHHADTYQRHIYDLYDPALKTSELNRILRGKCQAFRFNSNIFNSLKSVDLSGNNPAIYALFDLPSPANSVKGYDQTTNTNNNENLAHLWSALNLSRKGPYERLINDLHHIIVRTTPRNATELANALLYGIKDVLREYCIPRQKVASIVSEFTKIDGIHLYRQDDERKKLVSANAQFLANNHNNDLFNRPTTLFNDAMDRIKQTLNRPGWFIFVEQIFNHTDLGVPGYYSNLNVNIREVLVNIYQLCHDMSNFDPLLSRIENNKYKNSEFFVTDLVRLWAELQYHRIAY